MNKIRLSAVFVFAACLVLGTSTWAQSFSGTQEDGAESTSAQKEAEPVDLTFDINRIRSLFLTPWEAVAIEDAKNSRGLVRPVSEGAFQVDDEAILGPDGQPIDIGAEIEGTLKENEPLVIKPRNIALGGIVYKSKTDWIIWINGERITPDALPEEVLDLQVTREYVEMKWFDDFSNKIFPLRLRPNQKFNMDTLLFLPG